MNSNQRLVQLKAIVSTHPVLQQMNIKSVECRMTQLRYKLKIRLLSKKKPKKNVRSAIRKSKRRKMMNRPSFNNILMKQQHQQEFVPLKITSQSTNYLLTQIRVKTKESLTTRLEDTTLCTLVKFSSIDM